MSDWEKWPSWKTVGAGEVLGVGIVIALLVAVIFWVF